MLQGAPGVAMTQVPPDPEAVGAEQPADVRPADGD